MNYIGRWRVKSGLPISRIKLDGNGDNSDYSITLMEELGGSRANAIELIDMGAGISHVFAKRITEEGHLENGYGTQPFEVPSEDLERFFDGLGFLKKELGRGKKPVYQESEGDL